MNQGRIGYKVVGFVSTSQTRARFGEIGLVLNLVLPECIPLVIMKYFRIIKSTKCTVGPTKKESKKPLQVLGC